VTRGWARALPLVALAACATLRPPAPQAAPDSIEALAATAEAKSALSEHEHSAPARAELARQTRAAADACLAQAPQAAACQYAKALALGLEAREHPVQASTLLKQMLEGLARAEAADPGYDSAGPSRVSSLVLSRAPPWPLGPGDADAALDAALRAVELRPQYPPNWLALAEAQAGSGAHEEAQRSYTRAQGLALALPPSQERDGWLREAQQGLEQH